MKERGIKMKKRRGLLWLLLALLLCCNMQVLASDTTEEVEPEHVYEFTEFSWYLDNRCCRVWVKCRACEEAHNNIIECEVTSVVEEPTCTENGKITRTATIEINGNVYTDQKISTLEKLGHKFDDTDCVRCDAVRNPASVVTMVKERVVNYSGNAYVIKVQDVQGSTGEITYKYYVDKKCKKLTTSKNSGAKKEGGAPVQPGVYYVKATVAADDNYRETVTEASKLIICPRKVLNYKAVNTSKGIKLTWSKREEADGYIIYRKTSSGSKAATAVLEGKNKTSFVDTGWENGKRYYYNIVAYGDIYGNDDTVVISDKRASDIQAIHYDLTITNQNGSVKLKWKNNSNSGVKGYYIYRKRAGESKYTKAATIKKAKTVTWTDKSSKTLKNGKKAQYYIKAYYGKSNSVVTKSAEYTNYYLSKPTLSVSGDYMKWTKVSGASGYEVYVDNSIWGDLYYDVSSKETKYKTSAGAGDVKVRAFKKVNGKYYYSAWSNKKNMISELLNKYR